MKLQCPICYTEISQNKIVDNKAYCNCGAVITLRAPDEAPLVSKASFPMFLFALLFIGAFIHIVNWDSYSFSIIPLKMKQMTSTASVWDLKNIAHICKQRKKSQCEVQAIEQAYTLDKRELESLLRVGQIHMDNKDYHQAVLAYTKYYKAGGRNLESRYPLARALGEVGDFQSAQRQFQYILKFKQKTPQYQIARSYVELLLKNNEYTTAKVVIEQFRSAGSNSALFLEKELKEINQKTNGRFIAKSNRE